MSIAQTMTAFMNRSNELMCVLRAKMDSLYIPVNPLYIDKGYNDKTRYNDDFNETNP